MPAQLINSDHHYYDWEEYEEVLQDVVETILGWSGFTRERLGYQSHTRGFLEESRGEREKEVLRELMSLEKET
jgi:hypothetical protein